METNKSEQELRQDVTELEQQVSETSANRVRCEKDGMTFKNGLAAAKTQMVTAKKQNQDCSKLVERINSLTLEMEAANAAAASFASELSAVKTKLKKAKLKLYAVEKEALFLESLLPEIMGHLSPMLQWEQNNLLSSTYTSRNPDFKNSSGMLNRSSYDIAVAIFSALDKRK